MIFVKAGGGGRICLDEIPLMWGCLSGTMEYIFYHMGEGLPFSEAVGSAIDQDFADLDVREDLRS
jgi:homoserine dehydrogenase